MRQQKLPRFQLPAKARSRNMAAIKSQGNASTERRLRSFLVRQGIRGWTLHSPKEIGSPDFFFQKARALIFVHGCFWHACPLCGHVPKTNTAYWKAKLERNRKRDRRVTRIAKSLGYSVVKIWECDLRKRPISCLNRILRVVTERKLATTHTRSFV